MTAVLGAKEPDRQSRARRAGYDPAVLEDACVAVVGAGALGQNVLLDLALSGVRELRIADGDVFEDHNLTRSPLFPRGALGSAGLGKALAVGGETARMHTARDPIVRVADAWIEELGLGAFDGVDVIAACVDSLPARAYLAKAGILLGLPVVDGGFSGANVGMAAYPVGEDPAAAPCWRCGGEPLPGAFSCRQYAEHAAAAGVVPAIQNGAAVLGGLCAEAIVLMLHGAISAPRRISLDIRSGESLSFEPRPAAHCAPGHRRLGEPVRSDLGVDASPAELLAEFGDGPDALLFLPDVWVEGAACPSCLCGCEVCAPTHRWRRDPRCTSCGGPWTRTTDRPGPDVIAELDAAHPRADMTLASFGVAPGDLLEIHGDRTAAVRIAGTVEDLWREIEPSDRPA